MVYYLPNDIDFLASNIETLKEADTATREQEEVEREEEYYYYIY